LVGARRVGIPLSDIQIGFVTDGDPGRVRALEQLPIDSLWTGGHVASRNPSPEAMMNFARLSAVTERVKIGTAILLLPLYEPAIVAKQVADLDRATAGRVILGVGVGGEHPAEFRACRVPISERGRRTDEAIGLIRKLWSAKEISHRGPFYPVEDVRVHPAPIQPGGPPIVVAGRQASAMRRAALLGDGWMPYLYSPRRYAASVQTIHHLAEDYGRRLDEFGWYAFIFVNVHPDGARARNDAAHSMGRTYNQDFGTLVDNVAAAGTAEEVTATLVAFVEAGARHFVFMPAPGPDGNVDTVAHRLLEEVVPGVRERTADSGT
jgi:probable F420-dependent oxidoreductase